MRNPATTLMARCRIGIMGCFVLPFLVVWACVFVPSMLFCWSVAPAALSRWAEENGYRIERQKMLLLFGGTYAWNSGVYGIVYRVTVRDRDWHQRRGWVRLGRNWWPCLSVEECPVAVEWDRLPEAPPSSHSLWDRDMDA